MPLFFTSKVPPTIKCVAVALVILRSTSVDAQQERGDPEPIQLGYLDLVVAADLERIERAGATSEDMAQAGCDQWALSITDLSGLLSEMELAPSEGQYMSCYQLPCGYRTTVTANGKSYRLYINAGSWATLRRGEETTHFLLQAENDLFLTPCDCCEVERD